GERRRAGRRGCSRVGLRRRRNLHSRGARLILGRAQRGGGGCAGRRSCRRSGRRGIWAAGGGAVRGDARGRAARGRRGADARTQRPLLVRVRQEVQALPRRLGCWEPKMASTRPSETTPERLAAIREQLKLLADYL